MKKTYDWYAKFKWGGYLCVEEGDGESGPCEPCFYVGEEPTFFRTKEALRKAVREWPRGSFEIHHRIEYGDPLKRYI